MIPNEIREEIAEALRAADLAEAVKTAGEPQSGAFFWPNPGAVGAVETEIVSIIGANWQAPWILGDKGLHLAVQRLLWAVHGATTPEDLDDRVELGLDALSDDLSVELETQEIALEIRGMRAPETAIEIDGVRFGFITDLVDAKTARAAMSYPDTSATWAIVPIETPNEKERVRLARQRAESALDLMVSGKYQVRTNATSPLSVSIGSRWFPVGAEFRSPGHDRSWTVPPFEPHRKKDAPSPDPWLKIPEGGDLRVLFQEAFRRVGRAARLADSPEVAIPLALSGMEALLAERGDKMYTPAARLIVAGAMADAGVLWPTTLIGWFEDRNAIMHELRADAAVWTRSDADRFLYDVSRMLGLLIDLAGPQGINDRHGLIARVESSTSVGPAAEGVDAEVTRIDELLKSARTSAYRSILGVNREAWLDIAKRLKRMPGAAKKKGEGGTAGKPAA